MNQSTLEKLFRQHHARLMAEARAMLYDIRAHKPLIGANVTLLSADSTIIAQKEARQHWYAEGYDWETSEFSFEVPAQPAKYIFRISHVGFMMMPSAVLLPSFVAFWA